MNTPLVSVIMPAYNAADTLTTAIKSILQERQVDLELIVINDGSTDRTAEIIHDFEHDARLVVVGHSTNLGEASARNIGLRLAKGQYIANMDADDLSTAERFVRQTEFLDSHPDVHIIGSNAQLITTSGQYLEKSTIYHKDAEIKAAFLTLGKHLINPTIMMRRQWLTSQGGLCYNSQFTIGTDLDFWLNAVDRGSIFANLDEVLVSYRTYMTQQRQDNFYERLRCNKMLALQASQRYFPKLNYEEITLMSSQIAVSILPRLVIPATPKFAEVIDKAQQFTRSLYGENRDFIANYLNFLLQDYEKRLADHHSKPPRVNKH